MPNVHEFSFSKEHIEVIKVDDLTFEISFSDANLRRMQAEFFEFQNKQVVLEKKLAEANSAEDIETILDAIKEHLKGVIDSILGEGSFEKIYAKSGESAVEVTQFVVYLSDVMGQKTKQFLNDKRQKYVNNGNNKGTKKKKKNKKKHDAFTNKQAKNVNTL